MVKLVVVLSGLSHRGHSLPMNYSSFPFLYRKEWCLDLETKLINFYSKS